MVKYKAKRATQTAPEGVRTDGGESSQAVRTLPNSARGGTEAPSNPALSDIMRARMNAHFPGLDTSAPDADSAELPGAAKLARGSGRPLELPDEFQQTLESHFGHSVDNLSFRESSDTDAIGAKAYARGNEIHFAPGQFRPDTALGRKMIGHEVAHIQQQASGGLGSGVLLDGAMERQADADGDAVSALSDSVSADAFSAPSYSPMPAASFAAAPAQGWEIENPFGGGEHEELTEAARRKALKYVQEQAKTDSGNQNAAAYQAALRDPNLVLNDQKSLQYGSRFNDVRSHGFLDFLAHMGPNKGDPFINQTHHGDMQFLHSMDTSAGDTKENMAKAQRYAQFASDVYQNRDNMQDTNMLAYVLDSKDENGKPDARFQEMMLSTMFSHSKLKEIDKRLKKNAPVDETPEQYRNRRTQALLAEANVAQTKMEQAKEHYANKSKFKKMRAGSLEEYLQKKTGLSKYAVNSVGNFFTDGREDLDAGAVALASAAHMIEDSYAGSHAIRSENLFLQGPHATNLSENGKEIGEKSTPVIAAADYNKQSNLPKFGRHPMGDSFVGDEKDIDAKIDATRGGSLARDAAAQFMMMNVRMKYKNQMTENPNEMETYNQEGGIGDFMKSVFKADEFAASLQGGVTPSGSSYAKFVKPGDEKKDTAKAFYQSTGTRASNTHANADELLKLYDTQMAQLEQLRNSKNSEARTHYLQQSNELLANIQGLIDQYDKKIQTDDSLLTTDEALMRMNLIEKRDALKAQLGY